MPTISRTVREVGPAESSIFGGCTGNSGAFAGSLEGGIEPFLLSPGFGGRTGKIGTGSSSLMKR